MADFVKLAATAKRLVEKNGREVELFKADRTPADSTKPWRGSAARPTPAKGGRRIRAKMAFVPASGSGFGKLVADSGGSLQQAFDQVGLLASASLPTGVASREVEESDHVVDGDDVWKVVTRGHLRPSSTSVLFVLGLAR